MSEKIYGIPVSTPLNPEKVGGVKTINGIAPDENGNVEIPNAGGGAANFKTDETLKFENGVLSVNTASVMEENNTLPITSAAVYTVVGNINAILDTI